MKATELRIGNLYRYLHEDSESILGVDADFLKTQQQYDEDPDDEIFCRGWYATSIPLTGEWLLKLGFKAYGVNIGEAYKIDILGHKTLHVTLSVNIHAIFIKDVNEITTLRFADPSVGFGVHEIQNIFHVLDSSELKINKL